MRGALLSDEYRQAFSAMERLPERLHYLGNPSLLNRRKIAIVGSRRPNGYTKDMTHLLASGLSRQGICIVSGAAMGVDAVAHRSAGAGKTIAVLPTGIDIRYPAVNKKLIEEIELHGLTISQFDPAFRATPWSFVVRNETVVALGEAVIVTQADPNSGSMRSVEFALAMGKKVYVLPHRLGESEGTNTLLQEGKAEAIYDIDQFVGRYGDGHGNEEEPFLRFCRTSPAYDDAVATYRDQVYEAELEGVITVENGRIRLL